MTNHQVNDLAHSFVAMATAFERLPQVEHDLKEANEFLEMERDTVRDRELKIMELEAEIDKHLETIRSLEVAKDAAETMFLELDEQTTLAVNLVRDAQNALGFAVTKLAPPKPQPVEPPQVASTGTTGESEAHPTSAQSVTAHDGAAGQSSASAFGEQSHSDHAPPVPEVAASPDPTTTTTFSEHSSSVQDDTRSFDNPGPYTNQLYFHVPGWMSREDWIAGGGTQENYDWRPGQH